MDQTVNRPRLDGDDTFRIECGFTIDINDIHALVQCYQPLIHAQGVSVYLTLVSLGSTMFNPIDHLHLCTLCDLDIGNLSHTLQLLEQHQLLKTRYKPIDLHYDYLYSLVQPLCVSAFLSNPLFGRSLANTVAMDHFSLINKRFPSHLYDAAGYTEVTTPYDPTPIIHQWSGSSESRYRDVHGSIAETQTQIDGFDIQRFLAGLDDFQFPRPLRTDANLRAIAQLANAFNMNEMDMQLAMYRAIQKDGTEFSLNQLMHYCASHAPKVKTGIKREDMPPAQFLQSLKQGVALSDYETRAILDLVNKYHFSNALNNVIIARLIETNKRISKSGLDAYASYLVYNKVSTPESAVEVLKHYGAINKASGGYRYVESKPNYENAKQEGANITVLSEDEVETALKEVG